MEIFMYQNIKEYDFHLQYTALNKIYKDIFVHYGIVQFQCESVPHLNLAKVDLPCFDNLDMYNVYGSSFSLVLKVIYVLTLDMLVILPSFVLS